MENIRHRRGSTMLGVFINMTYTYDIADRAVSEQTNGAAPMTFTYDHIDQLTAGGSATFAYDALERFI